MPSGQPDFGLYAPTETIVGLSDLGELAARLGSPVTFDRRGNIIWMDDFESGIEKWYVDSAAGGENLLWVPTYSKSGGFCAKAITDAHADDDIRVTVALPYPALSRIGFEYSFRLGSNIKEIHIINQLYNGTNLIVGLLRWTAATKTWAYLDDSGYHDLTPTIDFRSTAPIPFNTLKLVCDFTTRMYVRLIANNTTYDLSSNTLRVGPGAGIPPHLSERVAIYTNANASADIYIDDAIVTQNEP